MNLSKPSLPNLTINLGITGHRDLPDGKIDGIKTQLNHTFSFVKDFVDYAFEKDLSKYYSLVPPKYFLISPLACGSDRIAAYSALENHFKLQCPIPFGRIGYKEDFETEDSKNEFDRLINDINCERVFELNIDFKDRSAAYLNIGEIVVGHSDILIAIWDGIENNKIGGTGHIVAIAKEQNVPILWIDSNKPENKKLLYLNQEIDFSETALKEVIKSLIYPDGDSDFDELYNNEPTRYWKFSSVSPRIKHLLINGFFKKISLRNERYSKNAQEGWSTFWYGLSAENGSCKTYAEENFKANYQWLDCLSMTYADSYRSAGILRHVSLFLSTLGLGIGFYYGFWYNGGGDKAPSIMLVREIGFAMQALFIYLIRRIYKKNEKERWHQKYIDYRILAEMLRHSILLTSIGTSVHGIILPAFLKKDGVNWINWHFRAIIRSAGIPNILVTAEQLANTRTLINNLLDSQIDYHSSSEINNRKISGRLKKASDFFATATFNVILLRVGVYILNALSFIQIMDGHLVDILVKTSNVLCLLFPALMLLFDSVSIQGGYDMLGQRSAAMKNDLKKLRELTSINADYLTLKQVIHSAAMLMVAEVSDWRLFVNTKKVKK